LVARFAVFFFSNRRRHTRCYRDWSSDVCSSDLLAFAVAAFLETEILLVDEVLAVGDASFQKKCLGKMRDVSANGRTVLFVSHNMAAIEALCSRCLLISQGRLRAERSEEHTSELQSR